MCALKSEVISRMRSAEGYRLRGSKFCQLAKYFYLMLYAHHLKGNELMCSCPGDASSRQLPLDDNGVPWRAQWGWWGDERQPWWSLIGSDESPSTIVSTGVAREFHQLPLSYALLVAWLADYSFRFELICLLLPKSFLPCFQTRREFLF